MIEDSVCWYHQSGPNYLCICNDFMKLNSQHNIQTERTACSDYPKRIKAAERLTKPVSVTHPHAVLIMSIDWKNTKTLTSSCCAKIPCVIQCEYCDDDDDDNKRLCLKLLLLKSTSKIKSINASDLICAAQTQANIYFSSYTAEVKSSFTYNLVFNSN